jgi:hypothetical protein
MGAWGDESCSNDGCWDLLTMENIHEPTQEQSDTCLDELFDTKPEWPQPYEVVGTIIWLLRHGMKVKEEYLKIGIELLETFNNEDHFKQWRDPESRKANVLKEKAQLEAALAGDGTIPEEHIPGLFEKIDEALGG